MLCFCASDSHINHLKEPYAVSIRRVLLFFFICLVYGQDQSSTEGS